MAGPCLLAEGGGVELSRGLFLLEGIEEELIDREIGFVWYGMR
jgi:hypothetical protein